jgi:hypothetical protein
VVKLVYEKFNLFDKTPRKEELKEDTQNIEFCYDVIIFNYTKYLVLAEQVMHL